MIVIGIDPGLTGALALLNHSAELLAVADMPVMLRGSGEGAVKNQVNPSALAQILREWTAPFDKNEVHVFIELQRAMPAVKPTPGKGKGYQILQGSSSLFSLGHTAGVVEATVAVLGFAHTIIAPADWKRDVLPRGASKDQARAIAVRLYPRAPISKVKHHNRAEAALIAKCGHARVS